MDVYGLVAKVEGYGCVLVEKGKLPIFTVPEGGDGFREKVSGGKTRGAWDLATAGGSYEALTEELQIHRTAGTSLETLGNRGLRMYKDEGDEALSLSPRYSMVSSPTKSVRLLTEEEHEIRKDEDERLNSRRITLEAKYAELKVQLQQVIQDQSGNETPILKQLSTLVDAIQRVKSCISNPEKELAEAVSRLEACDLLKDDGTYAALWREKRYFKHV